MFRNNRRETYFCIPNEVFTTGITGITGTSNTGNTDHKYSTCACVNNSEQQQQQQQK